MPLHNNEIAALFDRLADLPGIGEYIADKSDVIVTTGWLEANDVLNTRSLVELRKLLQ